MLFNRKITLYLNSDSGIKQEDILDAVTRAGRGNHFLTGQEEGKFEAFCNCGFEDCANRDPALKEVL